MSRYAVFITPAGLAGIKALPVDLRRRVGRLIYALAENPAPAGSHPLESGDLRNALGPGQVVRCLRVEGGRIVYIVSEARQIVDILAVRPRPPYDYDYLKQLIAKIK